MGQERITNDSGEIGIRYLRQQQKLVSVHGRQYVFTVRANISFSWINPEDVDLILSMLGGCCGQRKPGVFKLATEDDTRRWTNGGGR
jgi:hypothetical protein